MIWNSLKPSFFHQQALPSVFSSRQETCRNVYVWRRLFRHSCLLLSSRSKSCPLFLSFVDTFTFAVKCLVLMTSTCFPCTLLRQSREQSHAIANLYFVLQVTRWSHGASCIVCLFIYTELLNTLICISVVYNKLIHLSYPRWQLRL